jgi:hypothetical protein
VRNATSVRVLLTDDFKLGANRAKEISVQRPLAYRTVGYIMYAGTLKQLKH